MKNLLLTFALIITSLLGFSQKGITITVTVNNVTSNKGLVAMGLHTKDTFMKAKPVQAKISKIENNKVVIVFENVSPGTYAILGNHDANSNGRMDFNDNGMPLESYGASNNAMSFGPPKFSEAKFIVNDKNVDLSIRF